MACLNCGGDDDYGPCMCVLDAIGTRPPTARGSMRANQARRLAARSPTELAVAALRFDDRDGLVALADGGAVNVRVHTHLHRNGLVVELPAALPGGRDWARHRPTLTDRGLEAVKLLKSRKRSRKEENGAPARGE
jgi:hypothetical protein